METPPHRRRRPATLETPMPFTREEYYNDVCSYAADLRARCRKGEIRSTDALREDVEEMVDGSCWIIYTARALAVLGFTRNEDAAEDAIGWEGLCEGAGSFDELVTRKAYYAMLADVEAEIPSDDFDAENPSTWTVHERDPEDPGFSTCGEDADEVPVAADREAVTCPACLRYRARREAADASA